MSADGTRFHTAIVRQPADSFAAGITTSGLGAPEVELARRQHARYCDALRQLGLEVVSLPPDAAHPDSTFVEDTAVVTRHGAILARPGASSRAGEVAAMRTALERRFSELAAIEAPGTLDGGDVCQAGRHFYIGLSRRTNAEGARQLAAWLERSGYGATTIDIQSDGALLHLKSGLVSLDESTLVVTGSLAGHPALRGRDLLVVDSAESYAANCVRVNDAVLVPAGYPEIARRLAARGLDLVTLDMSEFAKMDGGLSCLSIRIP